MQEIFHQFITGIKEASPIELIAAIAGILSVWYSRNENILVYPVGLINTIFYVYISLRYHLAGEALVNFYYTIMSFYGWYVWVRKDQTLQPIVKISFSDKKMWAYQILFFVTMYLALYFALTYLKTVFFEGAIPWADALASASAFVGMWLMARKKVESWYWWILTNIVSIPLYFVKGLTVTSVYYLILLILAIAGLFSWQDKAWKQQKI